MGKSVRFGTDYDKKGYEMGKSKVDATGRSWGFE